MFINKAKSFKKSVYKYIQSNKSTDSTTSNQLRRASFSVMFNIAEGSSRFSNADRRHFYVISRGSIFECVAIFDFMKEEQLMNEDLHKDLYNKSEEMSKMIYAMIKNLS